MGCHTHMILESSQPPSRNHTYVKSDVSSVPLPCHLPPCMPINSPGNKIGKRVTAVPFGASVGWFQKRTTVWLLHVSAVKPLFSNVRGPRWERCPNPARGLPAGMLPGDGDPRTPGRGTR